MPIPFNPKRWFRPMYGVGCVVVGPSSISGVSRTGLRRVSKSRKFKCAGEGQCQ